MKYIINKTQGYLYVLSSDVSSYFVKCHQTSRQNAGRSHGFHQWYVYRAGTLRCGEAYRFPVSTSRKLIKVEHSLDRFLQQFKTLWYHIPVQSGIYLEVSHNPSSIALFLIPNSEAPKHHAVKIKIAIMPGTLLNTVTTEVPGPISKATVKKLDAFFDARAVQFVVDYEKSSGT